MAAAFFTLGVCGLLGTDDILGECLSMLPPSLNLENASADTLFWNPACFILGNSFSWDDWSVPWIGPQRQNCIGTC